MAVPVGIAVAQAAKKEATSAARQPSNSAALDVQVPSSTGEVWWVGALELRVPYRKNPPTIDGLMSPGEWEDAAALPAFFDTGRVGVVTNLASHQIQPQVYAGYDSNNSLRYGDYDAKDEKGQPLVALPPEDGTTYRVWFACRMGDRFSAFDGHGWNTTETKLILDSKSSAFQLNDLGPIADGKVDVQMTVKNHNTRSETVRIGFHVESTNGPVYSTHNIPAEFPNGLLELRPGESRKLRFRQDNLHLTLNNNVLWFDVRSMGSPEKTLFRTRLTKFQPTDDEARTKKRVKGF